MNAKREPSPLGDNGDGRDAQTGRFLAGHRFAVGNPYAKAVASWRAALVASISPADVRAVLRVLLTAAKSGEPWAVAELLNRTLGRPTQAVDIHDTRDDERAERQAQCDRVFLGNPELFEEAMLLSEKLVEADAKPSRRRNGKPRD
ncbi:MAG: hypothetical protein V2A79_19760 [Planctomycetota bacterium]